MNRLTLLAVSAAAQALVSPALAQEPAVPETRMEDVIVTGRVSPALLDEFVRTTVAAVPGRRLARWHREVCVDIRNISPEHAAYMRERIAGLAAEAGLEMAEAGCGSPVLILGSDDGAFTARTLVDHAPLAFHPMDWNSDLGRDALARFTTSDAPVRWWHVSLPVDADTGVPVSGSMVSATRGSRLRSETRDDLKRAVIIIDVARAGAAPFDVLSDYVAMAALIPADPERDPAPWPTIMNLFHQGRVEPGVTGLTSLDRDYLRAFYAASRDHSLLAQQRAEIVNRMALLRERRDGAEAD
ncbi:MAG: hypothetical protein ACXW3K_02805 [Brevundimonas sp.]